MYRNLPYELRPEEKYRQVPLKPRARKQCWRYGYFQIDFGVKITHQKCKDIKCNIYLKITLTEAYSSPIPSASTSDQVDYADTEDKGSGKVEVTADKTHVTAP